MPKRPPRRPEKGQPIPHDWFGDFYDYVRSLEVRGDLATTTVSRDRTGTIVRAPFATAGNQGGKSGSDSIIAVIDTDNGDGSYDASEVRLETSQTDNFAAPSNSPITFDSGNSGNLYELNGRAGVPVGTHVIVHRLPDSNTAGVYWYFDATSDQYGFDGITGGTSGGDGTVGAWVELTSNSSPYSWKQKDPDGSTDSSPAVTGASNLYEVSGRDGMVTGSIVWAWFDGTNYRCEYHGAPSGTKYAVLAGTSTTAQSDTWARDNQGANRGVDHEYVSRLALDSTTGALYAFCREKTYDANGHLLTISAESRKQFGTLDPTAITCATELNPADSSISSSLAAHLIADDIAGSDGASVSSWTASVGSNATQGTGSYQPVLKTALYNTHNAVRFDGTDDYLDWGGTLAGFETGAFTLFVVGVGSAGNFVADYDNQTTSPTDEKDGLFWDATGRFDTYEFGGSPFQDAKTSSGFGSLAVGAVVATNNGSTRNALFINGASDESSVTGGAVSCTASSNNTYVGAVPANSVPESIRGFLAGDICEIIAYSSALSTEQVEQISCYLISKYGVA